MRISFAVEVELVDRMGFEVLHGIVDCLWVVGEPISVFKEAVERETGILTEVELDHLPPHERWHRSLQPLHWNLCTVTERK
jgi:DNA polymerase elongation subunit (family B)